VRLTVREVDETMFEIARMTPLRTLELPPAIAEQFEPSDRFIVWQEGDTGHLKRITTSPLQAVENSADEPMSLEEINDVVHEVRRLRQQESQTR
jgi:hypothetical protein